MRGSRVYGFAAALLGLAAVLTFVGVGDAPGKLPNSQAFILGFVQGATELLPISSSGHLIIAPWLGNWRYLADNEAFNQTFDVALHLGTLLAVVGYFFRDLVELVRSWCASVAIRRIDTPEQRVAWTIVVATIPAGIVGLAFEDAIASHLGDPWQIAILLAVFAGVLWLADRRPAVKEISELSPVKHGLLVGIAQSIALMPGVSRSGITITAGRWLGLTRDAAARLSFLLLIPTVLGAVLLKGVKDVLLGELAPGWKGPFVVGTLAAWGSCLLAIEWLLGYVRRHTYGVFVIYRLFASAAILLIIALGIREATF